MDFFKSLLLFLAFGLRAFVESDSQPALSTDNSADSGETVEQVNNSMVVVLSESGADKSGAVSTTIRPPTTASTTLKGEVGEDEFYEYDNVFAASENSLTTETAAAIITPPSTITEAFVMKAINLTDEPGQIDPNIILPSIPKASQTAISLDEQDENQTDLGKVEVENIQNAGPASEISYFKESSEDDEVGGLYHHISQHLVESHSQEIENDVANLRTAAAEAVSTSEATSAASKAVKLRVEATTFATTTTTSSTQSHSKVTEATELDSLTVTAPNNVGPQQNSEAQMQPPPLHSFPNRGHPVGPSFYPNWPPPGYPYPYMPYAPPGSGFNPYAGQTPFDLNALAEKVARQLADQLATATTTTTTSTTTTTTATPITLASLLPENQLDLAELFNPETENGGFLDIASLLSGDEKEEVEEKDAEHQVEDGLQEEEKDYDYNYDYSNYIFQPDDEMFEDVDIAEVASEKVKNGQIKETKEQDEEEMFSVNDFGIDYDAFFGDYVLPEDDIDKLDRDLEAMEEESEAVRNATIEANRSFVKYKEFWYRHEKYFKQDQECDPDQPCVIQGRMVLSMVNLRGTHLLAGRNIAAHVNMQLNEDIEAFVDSLDICSGECDKNNSLINFVGVTFVKQGINTDDSIEVNFEINFKPLVNLTLSTRNLEVFLTASLKHGARGQLFVGPYLIKSPYELGISEPNLPKNWKKFQAHGDGSGGPYYGDSLTWPHLYYALMILGICFLIGGMCTIMFYNFFSDYVKKIETGIESKKLNAFRAAKEAISNHYMEIGTLKRNRDEAYEPMYWSPEVSSNSDNSRKSMKSVKSNKQPLYREVIVEVEIEAEEENNCETSAPPPPVIDAAARSPFLNRPLPRPPPSSSEFAWLDLMSSPDRKQETESNFKRMSKATRSLLPSFRKRLNPKTVSMVTESPPSDLKRANSMRLSATGKIGRNNRLTKSLLPKSRKLIRQKASFGLENKGFVRDNSDYLEMAKMSVSNLKRNSSSKLD